MRNLDGTPLTPEGLFNAKSTALFAPANTFYVSASAGSDSNPGTAAAPVQSIGKAVSLANATGQPAKLVIPAGLYTRALGMGTGAWPFPSADEAWVAIGGHVVICTCDVAAFPSFADDGNASQTYSASYGFVDRVLDLTQVNRFGNYVELTPVASQAIADKTPNSFASVSGTAYVHRADGAAVTSANTRILRGASNALNFPTPINLYMGDGVSSPNSWPPSGFDIQGASSGSQSGLQLSTATPGGTPHLAVFKNDSFKYAGGIVSTQGKNVGVESFYGLAAFFNVQADAAATDGFNLHNSFNAAYASMLTVNSSAFDNGRGPAQSDNCLTNHDISVMVDLGGLCRDNHGGSVRSILLAKAWLAGTFVQNDLGDLAFGGAVPQDAISVLDNATYWLDRVKVDMPAGTVSIGTESTGASIYQRNVWPTAGAVGGVGTIAPY